MKKKQYYPKRKTKNMRLDGWAKLSGLSGIATLIYFEWLNQEVTEWAIVIAVLVSLTVLFIPNILRLIKDRQYTKNYRNSTLFHIDKMDGIGFERYLKWLFEQRGFKAEVTQASNDYGADLLMKNGTVRIAVQAKRYKENVGIKAIQEIFTAKAFYDCDEAWVVTNSRYTKSAKLVAEKIGVRLIGRDELDSFVSTGKKEESFETYQEQHRNIKRDCPKCGQALTLRQGKNGSFYGCKSFPECRHTEQV